MLFVRSGALDHTPAWVAKQQDVPVALRDVAGLVPVHPVVPLGHESGPVAAQADSVPPLRPAWGLSTTPTRCLPPMESDTFQVVCWLNGSSVPSEEAMVRPTRWFRSSAEDGSPTGGERAVNEPRRPPP
jgi:hypothetical protein